MKYILMVAMAVFGLVSTQSAMSQSKKKQWCCTLGSKVAAFKSGGEKTRGKVRHICLDSKSRPNSPTSIYVKKCKRVSGSWRVTPEVGAIQIVENYAKPGKKNSYTRNSARKLNKKVRTKTVAKKDDSPAAKRKTKAKKKRVTVAGNKKKTKTVASAKKSRSKVAKKSRGKSGAKPKKARSKKKKKTKKTSKKTAKSNN